MSLRYLSVCSGIESASVAWEPLGWQPLAFAEVAKFPRKVLAHRFPQVPLHGDFTILRDQPWIADADLLVGGTPCQAFSVAGLRGSLSDARGNLTLEFVRLADAIDDLRRDHGREPAWILWENVPGVLNTADNAFGAFLGGLAGSDAAVEHSGGWSTAGVVAGPRRVVAWRTLDAQYFGVAQRRRRVFVLALAGAAGWSAADALLPLTEGGGGDSAPYAPAGETVGATVCRGTGDTGAVARCVTKGYGARLDPETETFVSDDDGVRHLTPTEVERCFGFPDGWTDIPGSSDRARYSALGNSMAVPVMRWIGKQINNVRGR